MTESELYEKQHKRYAVRVYPIFLRALQKQIQPVIDFIRRTGDTNPPLDLLIQQGDFKIPMNEAYEIIGQLSAKRQYYAIRAADGEVKALLSFLTEVWRKIFYDYSTDYAYRIDNELAETTKQEIRNALTYSYDNQLNADQTAAYIQKKVGREISRQRAVLIARTETTTASNLGKITGARSWLSEAGQKGYKQWIGRGDDRERSTHIALNDTFLPIDDHFSVGGSPALAPGDVELPAKERCNCRCTCIYLSERLYNRLMRDQNKNSFNLFDII